MKYQMQLSNVYRLLQGGGIQNADFQFYCQVCNHFPITRLAACHQYMNNENCLLHEAQQKIEQIDEEIALQQPATKPCESFPNGFPKNIGDQKGYLAYKELPIEIKTINLLQVDSGNNKK